MDTRKTCTCCHEVKSVMEFYKRRASKDGLSPKCKSCCRIYDKNRDNLEHRVLSRKKYSETEAGKLKCNAAKKKYIENNPKKRLAHIKVGNALRGGIIVKLPCEVCGATDVQAHHCDYNFPLEIMWLCVKHHAEWHRNNNPIV